MEPQWQKSSFSGQPDGDCLELAADRGQVLIRESDVPETVAATSPERLRAFIAALKTREPHELP